MTVAERGAAAALTTAALQAAPATVRVDLVLSAGARAFPQAAQDPRCVVPTTAGQPISCTVDQPATGSTTTLTFDLQVDGPGQTADMALFRGTVEEARLAAPIDLTPFESGLSVRYGTAPWTPVDGNSGTLSVSVAQAAAWDVPGVVLSIDLTGGAVLDPDNPTPGCTQVVAGNTAITCALPTIPASGTLDFDVRLVVTGAGQQVRFLALVVGGREATRLDQGVDLPPADGGAAGPG